MNKRLVRFTKWLLDAMFYGGMVITLGIPVIFRYVGRYIQSFRVHYIPQCVLYIGSGILALMIVRELRRMFGTVLADDAFVMENADSLKRIGKCSFFLAFISLSVSRLHPRRQPWLSLLCFPLQVCSALYCARCLNRPYGTKRKMT